MALPADDAGADNDAADAAISVFSITYISYINTIALHFSWRWPLTRISIDTLFVYFRDYATSRCHYATPRWCRAVIITFITFHAIVCFIDFNFISISISPDFELS